MADGHVGYVMPIGGVAAYRDQVSVVGVGFDIACGNAAIRTDVTLESLGRTPEKVQRTLEKIADAIADTVSFGIGRRNRADDAPVDHPLFDDPAWDAVPRKERQALLAKARQQLGTVGSGNHYVDVFADETGALWVGVHFGSRGFGHTVASAFLALGQGKAWGERVPEREVLLDLARARRARLLAPDEPRRPVRVRGPRVGRAEGRGAASAATSWSSCTTITTSPGRRRTAARRSSSSARARRRRSPGSSDSSAARWATTP